MPPGWVLGSGADLQLAMALRIRLAVDVAHLQICREAGTLDEATHRRVLDYDRIAEIHVSASRGLRDAHARIDLETPGLAWARERIVALPVVLESYWHRLDFDAQRRQLDLLRS